MSQYCSVGERVCIPVCEPFRCSVSKIMNRKFEIFAAVTTLPHPRLDAIVIEASRGRSIASPHAPGRTILDETWQYDSEFGRTTRTISVTRKGREHYNTGSCPVCWRAEA